MRRRSYELMDKYKTPESGRRLATALLASGEFHRPYLAPPKMRPELVKMLREAFNKTMKDPEFLAETKKKKLDMDPTTGEEVEALAERSDVPAARSDRAAQENDGEID